MAMLIRDDSAAQEQKRFFDSHLGNWAPAFFNDLAVARSAVFYKSVARFGSAFLSIETRYLSLPD
jgi:TorA maturation chaperone TorD